MFSRMCTTFYTPFPQSEQVIAHARPVRKMFIGRGVRPDAGREARKGGTEGGRENETAPDESPASRVERLGSRAGTKGTARDVSEAAGRRIIVIVRTPRREHEPRLAQAGEDASVRREADRAKARSGQRRAAWKGCRVSGRKTHPRKNRDQAKAWKPDAEGRPSGRTTAGRREEMVGGPRRGSPRPGLTDPILELTNRRPPPRRGSSAFCMMLHKP